MDGGVASGERLVPLENGVLLEVVVIKDRYTVLEV
jgi:hypothetical protein